MRFAIIYSSLSGNTQEMADLIHQTLLSYGTVDLVDANDRDESFILDHDHAFFGSYTWANGKLPDEMRNIMRDLLKDPRTTCDMASVFGTGDKQFPHFCRAVDEMVYHLEKHGFDKGASPLKVEQSPRNCQFKVREWARSARGVAPLMPI